MIRCLELASKKPGEGKVGGGTKPQDWPRARSWSLLKLGDAYRGFTIQSQIVWMLGHLQNIRFSEFPYVHVPSLT